VRLLPLLALALAGCSSLAPSAGPGQPAPTLSTDALASGLTANDVGITPTSILLGGTAPLSRPAAAYGTVPRAADAYFHYVNDHGGIFGRQIVYTYLDDAYNPAQTVPLTKQLVAQDHVFLMFAGLGTQAQTAVREYLNAASVPQLFIITGRRPSRTSSTTIPTPSASCRPIRARRASTPSPSCSTRRLPGWASSIRTTTTARTTWTD
jgi:ABC-type branched-subunit amino acid transport system substrate-binding protein